MTNTDVSDVQNELCPLHKTPDDNLPEEKEVRAPEEIRIIDEALDSTKPFLEELRYSKDTRFKVLLSICVSMAFNILGWTKGQLGPAFVDLLLISGCDVEKGSFFMTSYFTGRVIGPILAGILSMRINRYMLLVFSLLANTTTVVSIPWCFNFHLMMAAHLLHGMSGGILLVVVTKEAVSIWGPTTRGRSYLQIINAVFSVSAFLAPMATAPFLVQQREERNQLENVHVNLTTAYNDFDPTTSYISESNLTGNLVNVTFSQPKSRLYIAYTISGGLAIIAALPFMVIFKTSTVDTIHSVNERKMNFIGNLPKFVKYLQFFNIGVYSGVVTAVDFIFSGYLTVFCVQYLHWSKTSGSLLTSTYFFAKFIARCFGVFLVRFMQSQTILLTFVLLFSLGFVGILMSAYLNLELGLWISTFLIGFTAGVVWPTFISWTNEYFVTMNARVSAYIMSTAFLTLLVTPVLCGYLMEEVSMVWFLWLCMCKSLVSVVNVLFIFFYTRAVKKDKDKI
ncbi:sodium-dependent glucose transporter 1A-like [Argopecten irradians]|uniref:sodium-dependent glucose transporter 1A-like n=1 Tax=Argopecten irradians TaxID=31199 RepID=UPI0037219751